MSWLSFIQPIQAPMKSNSGLAETLTGAHYKNTCITSGAGDGLRLYFSANDVKQENQQMSQQKPDKKADGSCLQTQLEEIWE